MEHAHPPVLPPDPHTPQDGHSSQQTGRTTRTFHSVPTTPYPLAEGPFSLQQRRLQLRSAGFRAPRLPSHQISARLSRWTPSRTDSENPGSPNSPRYDSTPPTARRRQSTPDYGRARSPSVLQEITNSTNSIRQQSIRNKRHSVIPIFEDIAGSPPAGEDSPLPKYHDAVGAQESPSRREHSTTEQSPAMKLREVSGNAQTPPPLSSPLARQLKGRKKSKINLRKTSFEASQYIDHLEAQLQSTNESLISPSTGRPLQDKIKRLQAENKALQGHLDELEDNFEQRVQEAVEHKTVFEVELQQRIKSLEEEVTSKEAEIREVEDRDREKAINDQATIDNLRLANDKILREKHGLEETNRSLERRNDVLTELLAQSPTRSQRSQTNSNAVSPTREMFRKTPRPQSMMVRPPSSIDHARSPRPLSVQQSSPNLAASHDYFSPRTALTEQANHPANDPQKHSLDARSYDSGLGDSCSVRSPDGSASQRSSVISHASISPSAWGFPLPVSPTENKPDRPGRSRKLRRFASGSTSLKPLVLPAITGTSNASISSTSSMQGIVGSGRNFSGESFDPTRAFLSQDAFDTPTQPKRASMRSSAWVAEDALNALEGNTAQHYDSFEDVLAKHDSSTFGIHEDNTFSTADISVGLAQEYDPMTFTPNPLDQMILEEDDLALLHQQTLPSYGNTEVFPSLAGELAMADQYDLPPLDDLGLGNLELPPLTDMELPSLDTFQPSLKMDPLAYNFYHVQQPTFTPNVPPYAPTPPRQADMPTPIFNLNLLQTVSSSQEDSMQNETPQMKRRRRSLHDESGRRGGLKELTTLTPTPKIKRTMNAWSHLPTKPRIANSKKDVEASRANRRSRVLPSVETSQSPSSDRTSESRRPKQPRAFALKSKPTVSDVCRPSVIGTIARYSTYMAQFNADPTSVARRVIANAWRSRWVRLGGFSWWVLGLFLGRGHCERDTKNDRAQQKWAAAYGGVEGLDDLMSATPTSSGRSSTEPISSTGRDLARSGTRHRRKKPCPQEHKPSSTVAFNDKKVKRCSKCDRVAIEDPRSGDGKGQWSRSIFLWGKFSFALILAIGGAVVEGPAAMLKECQSCTEDSDVQASAASQASSSHGEMAEGVSRSRKSVTFDKATNRSEKGRPRRSRRQPTPFALNVPVSSTRSTTILPTTATTIWEHGFPRNTSKGNNGSSAERKTTAVKYNGGPDVLQRSKQRLDAQRDMLAADKMISFGSPSHNAYDTVDDYGGSKPSRAWPKKAGSVGVLDDEDKENEADTSDTYEEDDDDDWCKNDPSDDDADEDEYVETIKPRRIPERESIQHVTWFQNMGMMDFDRGRI